MLYTTSIKNDLKTWLNIEGNTEDGFLDLLVKTSTTKIMSLCDKSEDEVSNSEELKMLIFYKSILDYNKRFSEGIKSSSTSGFSVNYDVESDYNELLTKIKGVNKIKVLRPLC